MSRVVDPYRLSEGIWLEAAGVLLPWGAAFEELGKLGNPKQSSDGHVLFWPRETWLGGMGCSLLVDGGLSARLQNVTIRLHGDIASSVSGAFRFFELTTRDITERIGDPDTHEVEQFRNIARSSWSLGDVTISRSLVRPWDGWVTFTFVKWNGGLSA